MMKDHENTTESLDTQKSELVNPPEIDASPQMKEGPDDDQTPDDEIIGQAFRWSLGVIVIAATIIAIFFLWPRPVPTEEIITKEKGDISTLNLVSKQQTIPQFQFQNLGPEAGIDFVHFSGATGERLLPETMGGGVAIFDYNNDGLPDILFISGTTWPHDLDSEDEDSPASQPPHHGSSIRLYRNDGQAQFTDVTTEVGLDLQVYGMGCAIGDFDNDGWLDIYVTCVGPNRLFRNRQGRFEDVTEAAGVAGNEDEWSTAVGFFDFNKNGHLDLLICNYVQWNRELDYQVNFTLNGQDRAYGPPTHYQGCHPQLFVNQGDGTFFDQTADAGLQQINQDQNTPLGKSLGLLLIDINGDGWDDIVIANDTVRNQFFINQQDGTFLEQAVMAGLAYDRMGNSTGAMGIDLAHPWNDDCRAIAIGNFANEMSSLYISDGSVANFVDQSALIGIGAPTRQRLTFGTLWEDFDLDGRVDLLQVNGHLEDTISEIQPSQTFQQPAQLFWNNGATSGVTFTFVPEVEELYQPIVGRGAASGDLNGDGRIDLVITQIDGPPLVLINQTETNNRFLRVKLDSGGGNRFGFGAVIEAGASENELATRYLTPTRSYLSQTEPIVTFGFPADWETLPILKIRWPDGEIQILENVELDQTLLVVKEAVN